VNKNREKTKTKRQGMLYSLISSELTSNNEHFDNGVKNRFLGGYCMRERATPWAFGTLEEAMNKAEELPKCGGITLEPRRGYTLRKGRKLKTSSCENKLKDDIATWVKKFNVVVTPPSTPPPPSEELPVYEPQEDPPLYDTLPAVEPPVKKHKFKILPQTRIYTKSENPLIRVTCEKENIEGETIYYNVMGRVVLNSKGELSDKYYIDTDGDIAIMTM
jgi:hypothetical protein